MKKEHRRRVQDFRALLNINSLSLTNLRDRGLDEWEVLVAGDGGNMEKWVLTMKKDPACREQSESTALSVNNHRCGNQLHLRERHYNGLLVFTGAVCGVVATLITLMYWPDNL
jgi:hypothetical protein